MDGEKRTDVKINDKKIAVVQKEDSNFLGRIFWYTIAEADIPVDELEELYRELGIDKQYFPKTLRDDNVFKIVTKMAEHKGKFVYNDETIEYEDLIRDLKGTRILVRETKSDKLKHPQIGEWKLEGGEIESKLYDKRFKEEFDRITKLVKANFKKYKVTYRGKNIRDTLRDAIYTMNHIQLRPSGGVYFIPEIYSQIMDRFSELIRVINKRYKVSTWNSELITIPVIDTEPQRDMIMYKYEEETANTIDKVLVEVTEVLKDDDATITPAKYGKLIEQLNYMKDTKQKYEDLLEKKLSKTEEGLKFLNQQLVQLTSKVKEKEAVTSTTK